ncbi:hypothetical protein GCM10027436_81550 [Actinophytocola sediminis]
MTPAMRDPAEVLTPEELAAAHASADAAPPLTPTQIDRIADLFRPVTRQLIDNHRRTQ